LRIIDTEGREIALSGRAARFVLWIVLNAQWLTDHDYGRVAFHFAGEQLKVHKEQIEEG
jgi:hypothetical protein